jgi:hypothetical protein
MHRKRLRNGTVCAVSLELTEIPVLIVGGGQEDRGITDAPIGNAEVGLTHRRSRVATQSTKPAPRTRSCARYVAQLATLLPARAMYPTGEARPRILIWSGRPWSRRSGTCEEIEPGKRSLYIGLLGCPKPVLG